MKIAMQVFIICLLVCLIVLGLSTLYQSSIPDPEPVVLPVKSNIVKNGRLIKPRDPDAWYACCAFDDGTWPVKPMIQYTLFSDSLYIENANPAKTDYMFQHAKYIFVSGKKYKLVK